MSPPRNSGIKCYGHIGHSFHTKMKRLPKSQIRNLESTLNHEKKRYSSLCAEVVVKNCMQIRLAILVAIV